MTLLVRKKLHVSKLFEAMTVVSEQKYMELHCYLSPLQTIQLAKVTKYKVQWE